MAEQPVAETLMLGQAATHIIVQVRFCLLNVSAYKKFAKSVTSINNRICFIYKGAFIFFEKYNQPL